nr:hypothetical protein B0A51_17296 [Rachicladosporium sp. CCFEE 5018]
MSLMRAFTTRRNKPEELSSVIIGRAASQRGGKPILRTQISSPIALLSTSNMLALEAPQIQGAQPVFYRGASGSSTGSSSADDSDASTSANSIHSADTANTEMESSPVSPEPNHLSCYFKPAVETSANSSPLQSPHLSHVSSFDAPLIPSRAASHSKKAHVNLSRQRSLRVQSPPPSAHSSVEIFSQKQSSFVEAPRENPFGKELAQLDEVAEEFGNTVHSVEAEADAAHMHERDLAYFAAPDYVSEIHDLLNELFGEEEQTVSWF